MIKKAVRMKLYPGFEDEYKKRHDELWPEMHQILKEHGGDVYYIFLDPETNYLYGYMEIQDEELWAKTSDTEVNRKWWDYMADIMETNPDNSPVSVDLIQVFELK
ncbi:MULTISPECIES: L-rhamnose mutarotase [unclassified Enterococcus]|uniref:L-rhamnose mutarotase n=1 Tax=unclassified Enterococcus TaxID=2608891 RepID=UPI000A34B7AC|nr:MULTISPECIES: L-rhamnose mutarotase [unclassified Enterococcus]OTO77341.1 L-rhamnose 1-epimerase [Enterococcus sp. 12E11_DIV0728]OUZ16493.1 L-rhamnose 1-epimerase [Enterococcus sp. 12F9_DIV0723]